VTVWNRGKDLACEFFGKQGGALRLTARAEIPGAARICREMLLPAFCAANPREPSFKPSTRQEIIDGTYHHGA